MPNEVIIAINQLCPHPRSSKAHCSKKSKAILYLDKDDSNHINPTTKFPEGTRVESQDPRK